MPVTWDVTPVDAFSALASAYVDAIRAGTIAIASSYPPEVMAFLDGLIWWHRGVTDDDKDGLDMICWVEEEPTEITVNMSHVKMDTNEVTIAKELAFVPQGIDRYGPEIMNDIRDLVRR